MVKPLIKIGLIGDFNPAVVAHQAIPLALDRALSEQGVNLQFNWVPTIEITSATRISQFDGLWCVPASPYQSTEGALLAISHAREHQIPFLGTCGGFQHVVLEYARQGLGWQDAEHAEMVPNATRPVITALACALVEATAEVHILPATHLARAYQSTRITEGYRCRYGLNPAFRAALTSGPLRISAEDDDGEVRALELDAHPFFVATLFQPERAALADRPVPLVNAFVQAATAQQQILKNK